MALGTLITYEENEWLVDTCCTPPLYRIVGKDCGMNVEIWFHAEWRHGTYFRIKSVTYKGRTYQSPRYHYKYVPLVREAVFEIFKKDGLYDYGKNEMVLYEDKRKEILG